MSKTSMTPTSTLAQNAAQFLGVRAPGLRGVHAGSTWGKFKEAVAELGVTDADVLGSVEYGIARTATGRIAKEDGEYGIEIKELI